MELSTQTLADIATSVPGAAGVLRRHRLDFCCRGAQTLDEACRARGIEPGPVAVELSALEGKDGPTVEELRTLTPAALVDHIERRYHQPLRPALEDLVALARRVEKRHGENPSCPRGLAARLERGALELHDHLHKEEAVLFPAVRRGLGAELAGPVAVMRHEHDDHGAFLEELRQIAHDFVPPPGACNSWRALYLGLAEVERELHEHVLVENHILFPSLVG